MKSQRTILQRLDCRIGRFFREHGVNWLVFLVVYGVLVLGYGWVGYTLFNDAGEQSASPLDNLYQTLQLFVLESPETAKNVPIWLDLARYLAAFFSFATILSLLSVAFSDTYHMLRLRVLGNRHVVLCGLGERGVKFVERLRLDERFVVVIEPDGNHADLPLCRSLGAEVLIGSPNERFLLRRARVQFAEALLALFGEEDRRNVEIAVRAFEIKRDHHQSLGQDDGKPRPRFRVGHRRVDAPVAGKSGPKDRDHLACVLQIADTDLVNVVRKHDIYKNVSDRFDLEIFNMYDACARSMLREAFVQHEGKRPTHMMVVGLGQYGRLGETLILRAAKDRHVLESNAIGKLRIDVVDEDAERTIEELRAKYPELDELVDLRSLPYRHDDPHFLRRTYHPNVSGPADALDGSCPQAAFVCVPDEAEALATADHLCKTLPNWVPVIVRTLERDAGLGSLIDRQFQDEDRGEEDNDVIPIGLKDLVFQLADDLQPELDILARAVHHVYIENERRKGPRPENEKPALRFWDRLPETYRDSSRAQAEDLFRKLKQIHCHVVCVPDRFPTVLRLDDREVETLARDEHLRWLRERFDAGWRFGTTRDNDKLLHPNILPWDEAQYQEIRGFYPGVPQEHLDESDKGIDREQVKRLPEILALADYEVRRGTPPNASSKINGALRPENATHTTI